MREALETCLQDPLPAVVFLVWLCSCISNWKKICQNTDDSLSGREEKPWAGFGAVCPLAVCAGGLCHSVLCVSAQDPPGWVQCPFCSVCPRAAAGVWELLGFGSCSKLPFSPVSSSAPGWCEHVLVQPLCTLGRGSVLGSLAALLCRGAVSFCVFETYYCWFTWIIGFVLQEIGSNCFFFTFSCAVGDLLSTPGCLKLWFVEPSPE